MTYECKLINICNLGIIWLDMNFFNSFERKKTQKNEQTCADFAIEYVVFWRNLHHWQKCYTAIGSDGSDKYHLCPLWGKTLLKSEKIFFKYLASFLDAAGGQIFYL